MRHQPRLIRCFGGLTDHSSVIVAAGLRLHFLSHTFGSEQPLLRGVIPFTLLNIEMHYGLMAATMPTLKPFVGAFNTGFGTYDTQGISGYGHGSGGSFAMQSLERRTDQKGSTPKGSQLSNADREMGDLRPLYGKNVSHVRSPKQDSTRPLSSQSSSSQQMIIRQTVETEIHYEEEDMRRKDTASSRGASSQGAESSDYGHVKLH